MVILPFVGVTTLTLYLFVLIRGWRQGRIYNLAPIFLIPLFITAYDQTSGIQTEQATVVTTMVIDQPIERVWRELIEVKNIQPRELKTHFIHLMNIPRPISSEVDHFGVGGIRKITWESNVYFEEHITHWHPPHEMKYTIEKKNQIPQEAIDQHVKIGGKYFDLHDGGYKLREYLENGEQKTEVQLLVVYSLSTSMTWYSHFWSRFVLNDLQECILEVIKKRVEDPRKVKAP